MLAVLVDKRLIFDHLKVLMALGKKGFTDIAKVKYIGVDGDADAITQTVGGFTAAMTGEYFWCCWIYKIR